jgi:hypothetical protein
MCKCGYITGVDVHINGASCKLSARGQCCCCFVLRSGMHFAEAVMVDTAASEALALCAHVLDNEGALLPVAAPPESLILV